MLLLPALLLELGFFCVVSEEVVSEEFASWVASKRESSEVLWLVEVKGGFSTPGGALLFLLLSLLLLLSASDKFETALV